jgi:hypothetical protein
MGTGYDDPLKGLTAEDRWSSGLMSGDAQASPLLFLEA